MNTQAIEYIKENQNLLYRYCRKLTKDDNTAWDLLQNTYKFFMKNDTIIENVHIYVMSAINGRFVNSRRGKTQFNNRFYKELTENIKNKMIQETTALDAMLLEEKNNLNSILLEKLITKCPPRQALAVREYLRLGVLSGSPHFKNTNTFKASYLLALKKMKEYNV